MIKKILYLLSFLMLGYALMVIRKNPADLFNMVKKAQKPSIEEEVLNQEADPEPVQRTRKDQVINIVADSIVGDVYVSRHNNTEPLTQGRVLRYDDVIKTTKGSVAILKFANNSTIKVFSNSIFEITLLQSKERSSDKLQYNIFNLVQGAVLVDFVNYKKSHFLELTSKAAKLQIKGTQFLFLHNKDKIRSQLAVREGVVKSSSKGLLQAHYVKAGYGSIIHPATEIAAPSRASWLKKINWPKLAKGSGINLFDPEASSSSIAHWQSNRLKMQGLASTVTTRSRKPKKKSSKGFFDNALKSAKQVGGNLGAIAKKGAASLNAASPVKNVQDSQETIQNFEQGQKDRMKALDALDN